MSADRPEADRYAAQMLREVDPNEPDIVMWDLQTRPDGVWLGVRRKGAVVVGLLFDETAARAFLDAVEKAVAHRYDPEAPPYRGPRRDR